MPFTISHAVVALPFRRTRLPVAAVAVGSMSPDAVLFVPALPPYGYAHAPIGIVTIDLAVSVLVLAVWWWSVRPAWAAALPGRLPSGWSSRQRLTPGRVVGTLVGVLTGAVSHVVWDAGTHRTGWLVGRVPALRGEVLGHPVYSILQDGSSLLGLALLLVLGALWWWRRHRSEAAAGRPVPPLVPAVRLVAVLLVVAGALVLAVRLAAVGLAGGGFADLVVAAAFAVPPVLAVGLVVGAVVFRVLGASDPDRQERRQVGS